MSVTKLANARTDMETSTGTKGSFIDILLQLLPLLLAGCGLTPKAAQQEAIDDPDKATRRATIALVLNGYRLKDARIAAKGYVALALSTPPEDVDDVVAAIEA